MKKNVGFVYPIHTKPLFLSSATFFQSLYKSPRSQKSKFDHAFSFLPQTKMKMRIQRSSFPPVLPQNYSQLITFLGCTWAHPIIEY